MAAATFPPKTSPEDESRLLSQAVDWALSNGLVIRPPPTQTSPAPSGSAVHAPFSLYPSLFPSSAFTLAVQLQPLFNKLVDRLARDHAFISDIMDNLSKVDDFMARIYKVYQTVHKEGIKQSVCIGIHRSDYLLDLNTDTAATGDPVPKQVELNTIASSFSSLSTRVSRLHSFQFADNLVMFGLPALPKLPANESIYAVPKGLALGFSKFFGKISPLSSNSAAASAVIIMVVQPNERNAFDQRAIEYELLRTYKIQLLRMTLAEINRLASIDASSGNLIVNGKIVAVVYFRGGYSPNDYPTEHEWDARLTIEKSTAVKCPNIAHHIVGAKKVQQVLAEPGVLERYMDGEEDAKLLRSCFTGLYTLDDTAEGAKNAEMAIANPQKFVLKPQREGGGNNVYGADIPSFLSKLTPSERRAYILMDLIQPPEAQNIMVREGKAVHTSVISELGVYGVWVGDNASDSVYLNEACGHLLRTKSVGTNEGGVATGYSVLDSPLLY